MDRRHSLHTTWRRGGEEERRGEETKVKTERAKRKKKKEQIETAHNFKLNNKNKNNKSVC